MHFLNQANYRSCGFMICCCKVYENCCTRPLLHVVPNGGGRKFEMLLVSVYSVNFITMSACTFGDVDRIHFRSVVLVN